MDAAGPVQPPLGFRGCALGVLAGSSSITNETRLYLEL